MAAIRQSNFSVGEFAPGLHGRSDYPKYGGAVRRMRDMYPTIFGSVLNRSGTRRMGSQPLSRLIPFSFSDEQSYVLEFSNQKIRIWHNGDLIHLPHVVFGGTGVMVKTDDGITFTTDGMEDPPYTVHQIATNGTVYFAVASDAWTSCILQSSDGKTWTIKHSFADRKLLGIAWSGTSWVCSGYVSPAGPGGVWQYYILRSTDEFLNFTTQTFGAGAGTSGLVHAATEKVVVQASGSYIWISLDDGLTWALKSSASGGVPHVLSSGRIVVTGAAGANIYIAYSDDNGVSWTNVSPAVKPGIGLGISESPTGSLLITVRTDAAGDSPIYYSTDSGATWSPKGTLGLNVRSSMWYSQLSGYLITSDDADGKIYLYVPGTDTWSLLTTIGVDVRYAISTGPGGSGISEVVSPYAVTDLFNIDAVQSGDIVYLTCEGHVTRTLSRYGHSQWTLTDLPLSNSLGVPAAPVWTSGDAATAPLRTHEWVVTAEYADGSESLPSVAVSKSCFLTTTSTPSVITSAGVSGAVKYHFYRGRNGYRGWVGTSTTGVFNDDGHEPDFAILPPTGRNPFSTTSTRPRTATFLGDRFVLGSTLEDPNGVFMSKIARYNNFDFNELEIQDDDALTFFLASRRMEEIRWMVGKQKLIIGTNNGVWSMGGVGGPLSPTSVEALVQNENGSSWINPIHAHDNLLYIRNNLKSVRELRWDDSFQQYTTSELSLLSSHFFRDATIVDWAYAEEPHSLLWIVMSDGTLRSCTYHREQEVRGWASHTIPHGKVKSICSIFENGEDAVYMCVEHTENGVTSYAMERLTTRQNVGLTDGVFLDSSVSVTSEVKITSVAGLAHLEGLTVSVVADGVHVPDLVVNGGVVNFAANIPGGANIVHVGMLYMPELELLDIMQEATKPKLVSEVWFEVVGSRGIWAGETLQELSRFSEWLPRTAGVQTGRFKVAVSGRWGTGGRAALQIRNPMPVELLSVTREIAA